jgi:hypothetical protein
LTPSWNHNNLHPRTCLQTITFALLHHSLQVNFQFRVLPVTHRLGSRPASNVTNSYYHCHRPICGQVDLRSGEIPAVPLCSGPGPFLELLHPWFGVATYRRHDTTRHMHTALPIVTILSAQHKDSSLIFRYSDCQDLRCWLLVKLEGIYGTRT